MKKFVSMLAVLALCLGCMLSGISALAAEEEPAYFNAAKKEYFAEKAGPNVTISMEDVTDYNGVEGDTGLLVKMTPVAKDDTFTNGYVYMKLPLNVTNASVTLKVLGPTDGSDAPQAHFNKKVQWWSVSIRKPIQTCFPKAPRA